jgi:hypothetical protein
MHVYSHDQRLRLNLAVASFSRIGLKLGSDLLLLLGSQTSVFLQYTVSVESISNKILGCTELCYTYFLNLTNLLSPFEDYEHSHVNTQISISRCVRLCCVVLRKGEPG